MEREGRQQQGQASPAEAAAGVAQQARAGSRAPLVAAAIASLALLAVIGSVDYVPTHDGPQHVFIGFLNNHLTDADRSYRDVFQPHVAVTSLGFSIPFSVLEAVLPWRVALGATLSLIALAWAWGVFLLCRTMHPERAWVGLVGFASAGQWSLYMGFFSYVAACAVGFLLLAMALRRRPWGWKDRALIVVLLTVQAVFHVFGALVLGAWLGAVVIARHRGKALAKELGWLLAMAAPALVVVALAADNNAIGAALQPGYAATAIDRLTLADRVQIPAALFFGGPWWRRWPLAALSLAALALGIAGVARKKGSADELAIALGGLVLLVVSVAAPIHLARWDYFSPRFLPFAMMAPLALVPVERWAASRAAKVAVGVAAGAYLAANLVWMGWYNRDTRARCDDALAGVSAPLRRTGMRLPVVLEPGAGLAFTKLSSAMPFCMPLRNIGALYSIEQGGIVPYLFTGESGVYEYSLKPGLAFPRIPDRAYISPLFEARAPDAREREVILNYLISHGAGYEDVIVVGTAQDGEATLARGFAQDWRRAGVLLAHFQGCPTRLRLKASGAITHAVRVSYGWYPLMQAHWSSPAWRADSQQSVATIELPQAPCGTIWVRAVVDQDDSGELSAGDLVCERAAPDGIVLMRLSKEEPVVECGLVVAR